MRRCIFCGCTDDAACLVPLAQLDSKTMMRELGGPAAGGAMLAVLTDAAPTPNGRAMPCWWISENPPICSSPACRAEAEKLKRARFEITARGRAALGRLDMPASHVEDIIIEARG